MGKEIVVKLNISFEDAAYQQDDVEYWLARDPQVILNYAKQRNFGSLVSRVAVANAHKGIAYLSGSLHFSSRCLSGILSCYASFSKHLISHHHNPPTRYLQRELLKNHNLLWGVVGGA